MGIKGTIRTLEAQSREARLFAGEAAAKAAHAFADSDEAGAAAHLVTVERLARRSAALTQQARALRLEEGNQDNG